MIARFAEQLYAAGVKAERLESLGLLDATVELRDQLEQKMIEEVASRLPDTEGGDLVVEMNLAVPTLVLLFVDQEYDQLAEFQKGLEEIAEALSRPARRAFQRITRDLIDRAHDLTE